MALTELRFKQFEPLGNLFSSIYICLMIKISHMMINIVPPQPFVVTPIRLLSWIAKFRARLFNTF